MASAKEAAPAAFDPSKVKTVRRVTLPVLKLEPNKPVYVKVEKALYEGKEIKGQGTSREQMKPATLLDVVNLETGEQAQIVAPTVLVSNLTEGYPNNTYVGRKFKIVKNDKKEGVRYFTFDLSEIE